MDGIEEEERWSEGVLKCVGLTEIAYIIWNYGLHGGVPVQGVPRLPPNVIWD